MYMYTYVCTRLNDPVNTYVTYHCCIQTGLLSSFALAAMVDQLRHLHLFRVWFSLSAALDVQGLYRLSGAKNRMERICQLFEAVADRVDLSEQNPHLVASVLKLYLRKLPEPLMTFGLYSEFMSITKVRRYCTLYIYTIQMVCPTCTHMYKTVLSFVRELPSQCYTYMY